jgi:gamma-glutamyltranspeptidase / glutathione hydrolase
MSNRMAPADWSPPRRPVYAAEGMAATSHPLATLAAVETLREGGNALDAAISACAVQCVVEPQMTSIGGDCFAFFAPNGGDRIVAYNGSGCAPAALDSALLASRGIAAIARDSPHSVTLPGTIDAWARLNADHGRLELARLLVPAIRYAEAGYAVNARLAGHFARFRDRLNRHGATARVFLPHGGAPLRAGEVHRQPALAETLRCVAREGRNGFYRGAVAADIVQCLQALGGVHSLDDFAAYRGTYVEPIATQYRGVTIHECPPNGQGIVALQMLNILSGYDLARLAPLGAERLHLAVEAQRLAFRDRDSWIADPRRSSVPTEALLAPSYAASLRQQIDPARALATLPPPVLPGHKDTVYIAVVDRDRNVASLINSVFDAFGSGITAPLSGVLLQNRGAAFTADPGHPNCVAPGKRPLNTIIPGFASRAGRAVLSFGVMGGDYQPAGHVHLLGNWLDHGWDIQAAIDAPRVFHRDGAMEYENGIGAVALADLEGRGHRIRLAVQPIGGGQAVAIDWQAGTLIGASDSREDGCAMGY